jgi:hypothetical protein
LEATRYKIDLKEQSFLVEINRGQESLNHGDVGLFDLRTLVFHHIVELGVSSDFNHVQVSIGVFDHDFEELFHREVLIGLVVNVVEVNFKFERDTDHIDLSIFVFSLDFEVIGVHSVRIHVVS